jgi:hypothetical protein
MMEKTPPTEPKRPPQQAIERLFEGAANPDSPGNEPEAPRPPAEEQSP